jgi:hypothetical protein
MYANGAFAMGKRSKVSGVAEFCDGGEMVEMRLQFTDEPEAGAVGGRRPMRARDWSSVNWYGTIYVFEGKQRVAVAALWDAMEEGHRWVSQDTLLEATENEGGKIRDLFKRHPAWGRMIVPAVLFGGKVNWFGLSYPPV